MNLKSSLVYPLLKSFVPLLVGGTSHILKWAGSKVPFLESNSNFHHHDSDDVVISTKFDGVNSKEIPSDFLSLLNQISFGIYKNFFAFLLVMLLIDIICQIAQNGRQGVWKEAKSLLISRSKGSKGSRKKLFKLLDVISENQMMIRIFSYALIFISFQIVGLGLSYAFNESLTGVVTNSQSEVMDIQSHQDYFGIPRILSEEEEEERAEDHHEQMISTMSSDKISLSMRNVLSSLNLNVNAMVLSKDRKIVYATLNRDGTLHIIDISGLKSPFILGSLNLRSSFFGYRIKSLALSSDEKTLYASNSRELEIIDVTDPSSPKLISVTDSAIFTYANGNEMSEFFQTSLAVSEKTKTLYIGGVGLQVYDISNPKKPVLLKAFKGRKTLYSEETLENEICLSHGEQVLLMAGGTLDVYNISNPKDIKQLNSFKTGSNLRSLLLSEDGKTIFLLGSDDMGWLMIEEGDISNFNSLKVRNSFQSGYRNVNSRFLTVSPSKSKFFICDNRGGAIHDIRLLVFDYIKQTITEIEKNFMGNTFAMNFSPDGRTLLAGSNNQLLVIELYLDYPNSQIFGGSSENQISNFSLSSACLDFQISDDGKYLFIVRKATQEVDDPSYYPVFEIWDVSNSNAPRAMSSYGCREGISQVHLAKNYNTAYLLGETFLTVLDISNKSSITEKKTYTTQKRYQMLYRIVTSSDGKTGFLFVSNNGQGVVTFLNFSQSTSSGIQGFATLHPELSYTLPNLILKDDKTLIVLGQKIFIYDISNIHYPVEVASLPYGINEVIPEIDSYTLSPDKQILFIYAADGNQFTKLRIYNVSDASSPHLISDKYFSKYNVQPIPPKLFFPPHSENGFLFQGRSLIKLNLTDLKKPMVSGFIPLESNQIRALAFSPDGQMVYALFQNQIRIVNVNVEYTLYLSKEKYLLGEKYSNQILMLRLRGKSDYDLMDTESYRIIKLSLLDIQIAPNKFLLSYATSPLPSWMTFDEDGHTLTLNPKKQSDMGVYTLHSAFSLKVPVDVFNGKLIGTVEKPIISEDLIAWLMSLDYLDSELFVTAKFKSLETFYLPAQFLEYKTQIYNILRSFCLQTCTMFDVVSSLELSENNLAVSSLSTENIKAEIAVQPREGLEAKFVNIPYGSLLPAIRDNKTKAILEGTINEINTALKSIVVNFENGISSDATVVIKDGLNPQVSMVLRNISRYFLANTPPRLNNHTDHETLQEQINHADIQTGKYFSYTLPKDIFEDDYAESLTYEMVTGKNGTGFPTWLSFSGQTLKGTPPEEIFGRDLDLILVAKNEFKESRVPFKLQIKVSAVFWLKLLTRYSPYILTLLGLLVSANKLFNILAKRRYRHPKEYHLRVGEEISSEVIQPILFIQEELKQARVILKYFKKTWTDFIDPLNGVLNKQRIMEEIKEVIQEIPFKERETINRYPSQIIDQIIINKFVLKQLDSNKKTRSLFEELKSKCLEIVEIDPSSGITIQQNKLKKLLMPYDHSADNLEESLIPSTRVNTYLLKDAILAYAFDAHSVDISPVDVDITIKQLVPSRLLFSFLKLDLRDINLNDKNKIDYGINYRIRDDKLLFYGVVQSYFQKKTLAVQVKNARHKILKEVWIHGISNNLQESFLVQEEQESRGQGYEIF